MEALRASLGKRGAAAATANGKAAKVAEPEAIPAGALKERKGVRRAPAPAPAPARARASKK